MAKENKVARTASLVIRLDAKSKRQLQTMAAEGQRPMTFEIRRVIDDAFQQRAKVKDASSADAG